MAGLACAAVAGGGAALQAQVGGASGSSSAGVQVGADTGTQTGQDVTDAAPPAPGEGAASDLSVPAADPAAGIDTETSLDADTSIGNDTPRIGAETSGETDVDIDANENLGAEGTIGAEGAIGAEQGSGEASAELGVRETDRAYNDLGFQFQGQDGLVLSGFRDGSAAAQAGFLAGDRIVAVNGRRVTSRTQFNQLFLRNSTAQRIPVVVMRDGSEQTVYYQLDHMGDPALGARESGIAAHEKFSYDGAPAGRGALGVTLGQSAQGGVYISSLYPNGPAHSQGLTIGAEIVSVNGQSFNDNYAMADYLNQMPAGEQVALDVRQQGRVQNVNLTLAPWQTVFSSQPIAQLYGSSFGSAANAPQRVMRPNFQDLNGSQSLQSELERLRQENQDLRQQVDELEARLDSTADGATRTYNESTGVVNDELEETLPPAPTPATEATEATEEAIDDVDDVIDDTVEEIDEPALETQIETNADGGIELETERVDN